MELAMARVIRAMSAQGVRASVACIKGDGAINDSFGPDVCIHRLHAERGSRGLALRLAKLIRQVRPSLIHARNWGALPDVAIGRLLSIAPTPLVWSFHGLSEPLPIPRRRRLAMRLLASLATRVFTVSQASRQLLAEHVGLRASRIGVIPNGVDTQRFCPGPRLDANGGLVVGAVGSLITIKNHALLLLAARGARQQGVDLRMRIAGDGPLHRAILSQARALGLEDRLELVGQVDDVPAFLRTLDVFVLPSSSEQHPNALIEAMACGLPCIATDVGGVSEVLRGGEFGRLVRSHDASAITAAIVDLASDEPARRQLAKAGLEHVQQEYSMGRMIDAYVDLYAGLGKGKRQWL